VDTLFEFAESFELQEENRMRFAVEFFRYTITRDMLDMTILVQDHYGHFLLENSEECIECIIQAFQRNSLHTRMRIHALTCFIDKFKYSQVERLLNAIEGFLNGEKYNTYLVTNVNPILTGVMMINVLNQIAERYTVSEFRANAIIDILSEQCRMILVNLYLPTELKISVRRKNLSNHNSLYYMELMDAFKLMDTKVMDRIMKEYWNSEIDTSGSIFQASTAYQLLMPGAAVSKYEDNEQNHRFYLKRDIKKFRSHTLMLQVYLKSMQTRYFIELMLFVALAIFF
jgi:hypothetical protein